MLTGLALIIVAVFLCCTLLFRLSVHAMPVFAAFQAATAAYRSGSGIIAALTAAALAALAVIVAGQLLLASAKSDASCAAIGVVFAAPAAFAGYHALHGIAAHAMPQGAWQSVISMIGAAIIALASWAQWSRSAA